MVTPAARKTRVQLGLYCSNVYIQRTLGRDRGEGCKGDLCPDGPHNVSRIPANNRAVDHACIQTEKECAKPYKNMHICIYKCRLFVILIRMFGLQLASPCIKAILTQSTIWLFRVVEMRELHWVR